MQFIASIEKYKLKLTWQNSGGNNTKNNYVYG